MSKIHYWFQNCEADTKMKSMECASIATFYAGRNIFITGGTGFLGKVLIEKLLRSCPEIGYIFILMRPRKGLSIDDRLKKMCELPVSRKIFNCNIYVLVFFIIYFFLVI